MSTSVESEALARGLEKQVRSYFHLLGEQQVLDTRVRFRVHWLAFDANGRDRTKALANHLYARIIDFCIPRSRILEAQFLDRQEGGNAHLSMLQEEARTLFLNSTKSGEGGELLLFFLLEAELKLPQILCKMDLKTSPEMPIHGVDGVHAGWTDDGKVAVYWGESKLYEDAPAAMSACFKSIAPFLLDDGFGPARKDFLLVRDNLDAGEREISLRLVKYFTDDEPERLDLEIRGACLVGFSHDSHVDPFEPDGETLLEEVSSQVDAWAAGVQTRVKNRKISNFEIEFFCVPLPSAQRLRDAFNEKLGHAS
ncbi:HamA C-terminal domain-containing protein [Arenivirga flava]|uniref:Anti-bacteriophage protein A/HamA C-terminal domain-containing protein n=1 Tax=Arenivirga flava TaxID=1930060 RepID=A0AA37UNU8_9MICO|nr:DUF1837 domain-containing protein [Arenivirga flava]GMA29577.1 hypothetical protein GCM10025874_28300 [Arenivirga flava]